MEPNGLKLTTPETIHRLENNAVRAWPAEECLHVAGWGMRFTPRATTRRANSAFLADESDYSSLDLLTDAVESFYHARDRLPRFQIAADRSRDGLDQTLAERGYKIEAPVLVQCARAGDVVARANPIEDVIVDSNLTKPWRTVFEQTIHNPEDVAGRLDIIDRIQPHRGLAYLHHDEEPVAIGLGVIDDGWCGVFCMHTLPKARRQGKADQILSAIAQWAISRGAQDLYLQVEEDNDAALAFYESRGFEAAYRYHYRTLWNDL